VVDVDGFFHQVSAALGLAEVGTHASDGKGHGKALADKLEGFQVLPLADEGDVALDVDPRRTGELTGGHAVAIVLLEQELDEELPGFPDLPRIGGDHHALADDRAARWDELRFPVDLDDADATALQGPQDLAVTKGRNRDAALPCDLQNGDSRLGLKLSPIHYEVDFLVHE
jgi:hypothetical protein